MWIAIAISSKIEESIMIANMIAITLAPVL